MIGGKICLHDNLKRGRVMKELPKMEAWKTDKNYNEYENNGMSFLRDEYRRQKRNLPDLRLRISPPKPLDSDRRRPAGTAFPVSDYFIKGWEFRVQSGEFKVQNRIEDGKTSDSAILTY